MRRVLENAFLLAALAGIMGTATIDFATAQDKKEKSKAGDVKPDDEYFMSEYARRKGGAPSGTSAMMVPVGKKATVNELMRGIIIQSATMPPSPSPRT